MLFLYRTGIVTSFIMPSLYFGKESVNKYNFLFVSHNHYNSFLTHCLNISNKSFFFFSVKIKIRGLGFRTRELGPNSIYFFFNYTNFFYMLAPTNILLKLYKKRLLVTSPDWSVLKLVLAEILLLKELGPYRLRGSRSPKILYYWKKKNKLNKLHEKFINNGL